MPDPTSSPSPQELAAQGARCAVHPDVVAYAVCKRCGDFMCGSCSLGGQAAQCRNCRERTGSSTFPFTRERYTVEGLLRYSFDRFKAQWLPLCLSVLVFLGVIYGIAIAGTLVTGPSTLFAPSSAAGAAQTVTGMLAIQGSLQVLQLVLQLWLQLGLFAIVFDVLEGRDAQVATLFSRLRKLPALFALLLVMYLVLALLGAPVVAAYFMAPEWGRLRAAVITGVVMSIPAFYLLLGGAFAMFELAYNPASGPLTALRTSFRLASGKRWATLGIGIVSGVVTIVGVFACCVGMIPSMALGSMLVAAFYLALRTPATPA